MKVNLKTLIVISELKQSDVRYLFRYDFLKRKSLGEKYDLSELMYCRIFYWLIKYYGKERSFSMLYPYSIYEDKLTIKKFGIIEFTKSVVIQMQLTDELNSELAIEKLINNWSIFTEKKKIPDKFQGEIDLNICYLNLEAVKTEVAPPPFAA